MFHIPCINYMYQIYYVLWVYECNFIVIVISDLFQPLKGGKFKNTKMCSCTYHTWPQHIGGHYVITLHSFIPSACAECNDSLLFSGASSIPVSYVLFPATLLQQLVFHLFLGLPLGLVDSKFIYNTLLEILFSSILCTCPNQCNL
jgi:hypothetical protein